MKRKASPASVIAHIVFIMLCVTTVVPLILLLVVSFTDAVSFLERGFSFFPKAWSLAGYKFLFQGSKTIASSYRVTIIVTAVGTALGMLVTSMLAYVLSRRDYRLRRPVSFLVFFAMLFNAGLIPNYILMTQYYHLKESILALILPSLVNCWHVILLRTFFMDVPSEVLEAATVDGANEFRIYWGIMLPMSLPAIATVALLMMLGFWNQWQPSMLYISRPEDQMLQYYLYRLLREAELLRNEMQEFGSIGVGEMITDSVKFAAAVIVIGPLLLVFPFFQKYFVRGIASGAVKG